MKSLRVAQRKEVLFPRNSKRTDFSYGVKGFIRNAEFYSIIADEASDVSHKEQLVVCIRWVDNDFETHEDPIEHIKLMQTLLTTCIKDCLVRCCLPISQCRGQAYDGASNMSGYLSGVPAQIQTDTPSALYVHYLAQPVFTSHWSSVYPN